MICNETANCSAEKWLSRTPEALVVNGYREWMHGVVRSDKTHWKQAHNLHIHQLGIERGRAASIALVQLIDTLGKCASCPLRFYPSGSEHLCRDECLYLGMISSVQHGDDDAQKVSVETLACPLKGLRLLAAAANYATHLKSAGIVVTPIPADRLTTTFSVSAKTTTIRNVLSLRLVLSGPNFGTGTSKRLSA